jgi:hypothetical protein
VVLRYNDELKQLTDDGYYCGKAPGRCISEVLEVRNGSLYALYVETKLNRECPAQYIVYDSQLRALRQVITNSVCGATTASSNCHKSKLSWLKRLFFT